MQRPDYANFVSAMDTLKPCVEPCLELRKAVQELAVFVENLRRIPLNLTAEEQLKIIYPVRWWFRFLPTRFLQQTNSDPWVMVVLAFYNLVALAVDPIMPALGIAYFTIAKARMIEAIGSFVGTLARDPLHLGIVTPHSMMELARSLAREYAPKQTHID